MSFIWAIIVGAVIGFLAQLILPGKSATTWWMTIILGVIGAVLGNMIAGWIGVKDTKGIDWIRHLLQLGMGIVVIAIIYPAVSKMVGGFGSKARHS
jgi:uncharacterized membrane protein YeaQ/YmgE (transglycosylase-associated protein family)